jgi:hypothetical protein
VAAQTTRTINQTKAQNLLGLAARGCGGALNSFLVVLGEGQIVRSNAPSIGQQDNSNTAARGPTLAQGSGILGADPALSNQREETAFMTLMCHECAAAAWHIGRPRSPQG